MEHINYRFLLDPHLLKSKRFTPKHIPNLHYDPRIEERALREWQQALLEQEERRTSLAQLTSKRKASAASLADKNMTFAKVESTNSAMAPPTTDASLEEVANTYLPDETDGRKIAFQAIYEVGRREGAGVEVCLNAYFLSPDDPSRSIEFLRSFLALRELGFPENDISVALLQTGNDRDKAIDLLMK